MGSYVLIDRPNVDEERSNSILNYQSKELGSQSIKSKSEKNATSKGKIRRKSNQ